MKKKSIRKTIRFVVGGIAGLCVLFITALFLISGGFMKQTYLEPWSKSYADQYSDPRIQLAASGLLAASNHNMQPWKIRLDPSNPMVFYLYADHTRVTPEVDPYARQMMISQGTFLEYVAVAGAEKGWKTEIRLFPDGTYDESRLADSMDEKPVAKITMTKASAENSALYAATFLPDTNRSSYGSEPLSAAQVNALESLSSTDDCSIRLYQDQDSLDRIGKYAMKSAAIEAGVSRVMEESDAIFRPNEYRKNEYRWGYSVEGQGATGFRRTLLQGLVTVFPSLNTGKAASQNFINYTKISVDHTPAYAMIVSNGNSRLEQVESGMLYSRLVLTGQTLGLAMQPLSQVLEEYPEMQVPYTEFQQTYAPGGSTVQMLFRVGVPTQSVPLSIRRDVLSLLDTKS